MTTHFWQGKPHYPEPSLLVNFVGFHFDNRNRLMDLIDGRLIRGVRMGLVQDG